MNLSEYKKPFISGIVFSLTVVGISFAYSAFSYIITASHTSSGSMLSHIEWNKIVTDLTTINSQLSATDSAANSALAVANSASWAANSALSIANAAQSATATLAIPAWAIMAFNLTNCPSGWSEYTPAYWRFIRGIDKSGASIDPDGQRSLGSVQEDAFQSHTHNYQTPERLSTTNRWSGTSVWNLWSSVAYPTESTSGRTAAETRSKNVALLYCVKS